MEQITARKPHTYTHTHTCDAQTVMEMSGINSAGEMENVFGPYVLSLYTIPLSKSIFPHFLLLSPSSALAAHSFTK